MGSINIYVACHKDSYLPANPLLKPIQVGAANASVKLPGMLRDDQGEQISAKNPSYCELTAQYWMWKNVEAEYYGLFHYRRYLSFADVELPHNAFQDVELLRPDEQTMEKLGYQPKDLERRIRQYDVITSRPAKLKELNHSFRCNVDQYTAKPYEYKEDLEVLLEIIKEQSPALYPYAETYLYHMEEGYFCNMFIMRAEVFREYSSWLFSILEEHERRRDYSNYNIDGYRVSGYLGERLFGIYYCYLKDKGLRTLELQRVLFSNTEPAPCLRPLGGEKAVPIVLATNDKYAPYAGALVQSILEQASPERFYDILVLSHDISEQNRQFLQTILEEYAKSLAGKDESESTLPEGRADFTTNRNERGEKKHVSLRIADPNSFLEGYDLQTRAHFSVETYYRLVLPQFLKDYQKVLYLDVDMIVKEDVAKLYDTELGTHLVGAVADVDTAGLYNGFDPGKKKYMDENLGLEDPYQYFQAGTLLMNLEEFRKSFSLEQVLQVATSKRWELLDQDILNVLCKGRVYYLDMKWNLLYDYGKVRVEQIFRLAPYLMYQAYLAARRCPSIIHYAGPEKPWLYPECDFAWEFWRVARKLPYYEQLLYRLSDSGSKRKAPTQRAGFAKKSSNPIYLTLRCLRLYGVRQTLREIMRHCRK